MWSPALSWVGALLCNAPGRQTGIVYRVTGTRAAVYGLPPHQLRVRHGTMGTSEEPSRSGKANLVPGNARIFR